MSGHDGATGPPGLLPGTSSPSLSPPAAASVTDFLPPYICLSSLLISLESRAFSEAQRSGVPRSGPHGEM